MASLVYKERAYGGTAITNIVQESAFEIVVENGDYVLYWYGAKNACPYSVELENGAYVLYFNYETD